MHRDTPLCSDDVHVAVAGVEYASECYCGRKEPTLGRLPESRCACFSWKQTLSPLVTSCFLTNLSTDAKLHVVVTHQ